MDTVTPEKRSQIMSRIVGNNLKPEATLHAALQAATMPAYTRNDRQLPGSPDFCFYDETYDYVLAVFVHGCFWHGCPRHYKRPHSNQEFWDKKLRGNIARDRRNRRELGAMGISVMWVWECQVKKTLAAQISRIRRRLRRVMVPI